MPEIGEDLSVRAAGFTTSWAPITSETSVLGLDHHLEGMRIGGVREGLVGIDDAIQLEAVGNQQFRVDLVRPQAVEQHRCTDGIDQPRGDGDVAIPKVLQVEINLRSMHTDIGDDAARLR